MVWGVFPVDPLSGEDKYYILSRGSYKVGRKGCDVIINKDKGVSRIHAEIFVDEMISLYPLQRSSSNINSNVRIRDCSKYGTFINKNGGSKEKLHEFPDKETTLKDGDLISFGTGSATYRFSYVPLQLFVYCSDLIQVNASIQEKVSSIGAYLTSNFCLECTHVLVHNQMPLTKDLIDAILAKKPLVTDGWLESVAEKSICTEFPSCNFSIVTLMVEGVPFELANSETRKNCLEAYTFLLESIDEYKYGYRLQSLLELGGAKTLSIERFCSSSQDLEYGDLNCVVFIIPRRSKDDSNCFNKLSSLPRVDEMDLICAVLSGRLDPSILKTPSVLISSSCSTDETVVADSDVEAQTSSLVNATSAATTEEAPKYLRKDEIFVNYANNSMTGSREKANEADVVALTDEAPKCLTKEEISINHANSSIAESREKVDEADTQVLAKEPPKYLRKGEISINHANNSMTRCREKADESECEHSVVIYSQDLVVRDLNFSATFSPTATNGVINFKCFREINTQSGNSFSSLIPFSKYPYKDMDFGTAEMVESVKEEKKRKQAEAIAEDLFNNEKGRKRGVAGSLHGLLTR